MLECVLTFAARAFHAFLFIPLVAVLQGIIFTFGK